MAQLLAKIQTGSPSRGKVSTSSAVDVAFRFVSLIVFIFVFLSRSRQEGCQEKLGADTSFQEKRVALSLLLLPLFLLLHMFSCRLLPWLRTTMFPHAART